VLGIKTRDVPADKDAMAAHISIPTLGAALLLTACAVPPASNQPPTTPAVAVVDTPGPAATDPESVPTGQTLLAAAEPVAGIHVLGYAPPPITNLWQALRDDFGLPQQDNPRIDVQRQWYAKHPRYMQRVTERARRYAWYIHQELQARDMPAEIALLPIVESAYDPFAYSHGRAAGLWQFIPSTGKRFGLTQNWWYDGRRDIPDSTNAALDYLQYLHKRFDGDWMLALAAYNSGEGTVLEALRHNRKKGRPSTFWDLKLPKETRDYVPKLLALSQLVSRPADFGIELEPVPNRANFHIVDTGGQIDLAVAADLAGIDLETLYRLNPGFNQWATAPKGPHRLLVPASATATFRQAIAQLPPEQRIQWERVKIKDGETLSHIARRYRTTVEVLETANQVRATSIRAGKYLMVPVASQAGESYKLSAAQRLNRKQNSARGGYKTRHVVRNGDTLWELSREYKVGVRSLASWNGMAPGDTLRVGQTLVVWSGKQSSASLNPGTQRRPVHYTVRKGDSLSRIADRFNVNVTDLRRWNTLPKGEHLQPGQHIKLYVDVTRQTDA
jgi:membrane-bound lytic murein transglycosylase D